jgi:transcriptional regulator with AAA-type ATPase domain
VDDTITEKNTRSGQRSAPSPTPGFVVVVRGGQPACDATPAATRAWTFGRKAGECDVSLDDARLSRRHASVQWIPGGWLVENHSSTNVTRVNGVDVQGRMYLRGRGVVVLGRSIVLLDDDINRFLVHRGVEVSDRIEGPTLRACLDEVRYAARERLNLLVSAETGSGKEHAAAVFHAASPNAQGKLISVNCATVKPEMAERVFFGAKRGAYSGAVSDECGHFEAAHGGVLHLDEVQQLDTQVQASLLRAIELKEVVRLGESVARKVNVLVVCTTNVDLEARVAAGTFRDDLLYRIRQHHVRLRPLRERLEEHAYLVRLAIGESRHSLQPRANLLESVLLRPWPGNIRNMLDEVRGAVRRATLRQDDKLDVTDLPPAPPIDRERFPAPTNTPVVEASQFGELAASLPPEKLAELRAFQVEFARCGDVRAAGEALGFGKSKAYELKDLLDGKVPRKR